MIDANYIKHLLLTDTMRYKTDLYAKEQNELIDKIIDILCLDDNNSISLYELDNDNTKTEMIMRLLPELRTFFTYNKIPGINDPYNIHITRKKYKMFTSDYAIRMTDKVIRSKRYTFIKNKILKDEKTI